MNEPNKMPFKCVVCNGYGTLKNGTLTCHGCDGKGWVVVDQDRQTDYQDIQKGNYEGEVHDR